MDSDPEPAPIDLAARYLGITPDGPSRRRGIREFLVGAATAAGFIPVLFYLRFGELNGYAWGVTTFLVVLQLLGALALFFRPRTGYHTTVAMKDGWVYGAKVLLTIVIPVGTALPLLRYARGRAALVAVPLLVLVTALPVLTGVNTAWDLVAGPQYAHLLHTDRDVHH